jgi:excisionase family DNA binding protein
MARQTAIELSLTPRAGPDEGSFGEFGKGPTRSLAAEIDRMSTGNQHQIAVLSSQPAVIGRLFLTVEEAAQRLGVTAGWICERTRRKAIPHRKLGKFVRFTEEDLRAIVEAAAKGST